MKDNAIAKVNNVNIVVGEDPLQLVPLLPICDALMLDASAQFERIKRDDISSSVVRVTRTTESDGKQSETISLPLKFAFGWVYAIELPMVNEEAHSEVVRYKLECYNALYDYFAGAQTYLKEKQFTIDSMAREYFALQDDFKEARQKLTVGRKNFLDALNVDYATWTGNSGQLILPFEEVYHEDEEV